MFKLSAKAEIVLSYAKLHADGGLAEIHDDIGLPENVVKSACEELRSSGRISDFKGSDDSVEFIQL